MPTHRPPAAFGDRPLSVCNCDVECVGAAPLQIVESGHRRLAKPDRPVPRFSFFSSSFSSSPQTIHQPNIPPDIPHTVRGTLRLARFYFLRGLHVLADNFQAITDHLACRATAWFSPSIQPVSTHRHGIYPTPRPAASSIPNSIAPADVMHAVPFPPLPGSIPFPSPPFIPVPPATPKSPSPTPWVSPFHQSDQLRVKRKRVRQRGPQLVELHGCVGEGGFGTVMAATVAPPVHPDHPDYSATDIVVKLSKRTPDNVDIITKEYNLQKKLADILPLPRPVNLFNHGEYVGFGMQRVRGPNLHSLIANRGPLSHQSAANVMADLMYTLSVMHRHRIAHMDVKLENILTKVDRGHTVLIGDIRLIDFGMAFENRRIVSASQEEFTVVGTPGYAAPEVLFRSSYDPYAADIFSAGILWTRLLSQRPIFHATSYSTYAIEMQQLNFNVPVDGIVHDDVLQKLLSRMVANDPSSRPTAAEATDIIESHLCI